MQKLENSNNKFLPLLKNYWHLIVLTLIGILSFWFNFYAISKYGYGNEYYAAAIKSMTLSFKNFFFVAFDPAGMVSVDKPPLGLWTQAISVLVFGYHGWAMLLPQALAGTASCIMVYILTAKHFGRPAGLISSLIFALTPVVVVASRNNTMDMQLIFVLLVATWFLFKSINTGKWRYLFIAALFIGLGFNIKMLQAYTILPAFAIVYLFFAKEKLIKRFAAGIISMIIVVAVSFSWATVVDLYPSSQRPYVDSTSNNSVFELILGHNGLERITGQGTTGGMGGGSGKMGTPPSMNGENGNPPSMPTQNNSNNSTNSNPNSNTFNPNNNQNNSNNNQTTNNTQNSSSNNANQSTNSQNNNMGNPPQMQGAQGNNMGTPPEMGKGGGPNGGQQGGGMGSSEIGTASISRLWSTNLYGQISWLLLTAICGIIVFIRKINLKKLTEKQCVLAFWGSWLATMGAFFSFAGFYHRYYLCMMAPEIAVLAGVGIVKMYEEFRAKASWRQFMLPISLVGTIALQFKCVWSYTALRSWLVPLMAVTAIASLVLMAVNYIKQKRIISLAATGFMIVSILAAPFYWSLTPVMYVTNTTMPYADPNLGSQNNMGVPNMPGGSSSKNNTTTKTNTNSTTTKISSKSKATAKSSGLENYLVSNYTEGSFLVVAQRSNTVAQMIINTGLPAYAYGGFLGSDNSLTLDKLKELVKEGKITYFLISGEGGGNENSEIISYVKQHATLIDPTEYGGTSTKTNTNNSNTNINSTSKTNNTSSNQNTTTNQSNNGTKNNESSQNEQNTQNNENSGIQGHGGGMNEGSLYLFK